VRLGFVALSSVLFAIGCAAKVPPAKPQPVPDIKEPLPAGHALIVFARATAYRDADPAFIFDAAGNFVGEVPMESRLHVTVPPGTYTFVGWHVNLDGQHDRPSLVTGGVDAGRVYLVQLEQWSTPMQMLSTPLALVECERVAAILKTQRIRANELRGIIDPEVVRMQVLEATALHKKLESEGRDRFWRFQESGGTWEAFFLPRGPREPEPTCPDRQRLVDDSFDRRGWAEYLATVPEVELAWVRR
jgi:hypothetical protein